jgi:GNAT superfamily N-acetyltransferase
MLRIVRVQSKREIDAVRRLIAFSGGAVATAFDRYSEPRGTMLLAYLDGIPVGCAALRPLTLVDGDQAIGHIDHLTVTPAGQRPGAAGGGIGRALLLFLIDEARVRGVTDESDIVMTFGKSIHHRSGSIGAAIIYNNDFKHPKAPLQGLP